MTEEQKQALIQLLREMNARQTRTDEDGEREIAWYYWRDDIENALGLVRGSLDARWDEDDVLIDSEAQR